MSRRALALHSILALALGLAVAGCGSNDNGSRFESCGDGVVDKGEQCDDGNLVDEDGCTSTCEINVCGDGLIDQRVVNGHQVEDCEFVPPPGTSCRTLGFAEGTLACAADCKFDTSGCSGVTPATPTPGPTPTGGEVGTPTATPGGVPATPTATATPGTGATCQDGQTVVVAASLDQPYAGFTVNVAYPPASVNLPGSGANVADRVTFAVSGLTSASDEDRIDDDGVDDTLIATFASGTSRTPGLVVTVTFDCVAGAPRPSAGDFTCTASASDSTGTDIPDIGCSLAVQ